MQVFNLQPLASADGWEIDDQEAVDFALRMVDGDVPLEGWVSLARDFLERMRPPETPTD